MRKLPGLEPNPVTSANGLGISALRAASVRRETSACGRRLKRSTFLASDKRQLLVGDVQRHPNQIVAAAQNKKNVCCQIHAESTQKETSSKRDASTACMRTAHPCQKYDRDDD